VLARFFFLTHGTLVEDPGTGSAAANLGGWLALTGAAVPKTVAIRQGEKTGRPCRITLRVDAEGRSHVTGRVIEIGEGTIWA
jgi:predicted PhzF superfamily epimerase YddE/YHI9